MVTVGAALSGFPPLTGIYCALSAVVAATVTGIAAGRAGPWASRPPGQP
jgi:hypothetical protein